MKKVFLFCGFIAMSTCLTSCDMFKSKKRTVYADPNGSVEERVEYHKSEIAKYEKALKKEQKMENTSMKKGNMSEVRRANNRKIQYQRKIIEHKEAILRLEKGELAERPFVGR